MRHDLPYRVGLKILAGAMVTGLFIGADSASAAPPLETGVWINHTGKGAVEIRPCDAAGRGASQLCGYIVWLKEPTNRRGEPLTDGYNRDPSKRKRTICGLPVLGALQRIDGGWDNGWVYDPEQGSSFDAAIQLTSRDKLILTGYKGVKFFSKSFTWRRAPADLPRCDGEAHEAKAPAATQVARKPTETGSVPFKVPRPVPAVRPKAID